jgi:hypothetical protein
VRLIERLHDAAFEGPESVAALDESLEVPIDSAIFQFTLPTGAKGVRATKLA